MCAAPDGKLGQEKNPEPEASFALSGKLAFERNIAGASKATSLTLSQLVSLVCASAESDGKPGKEEKPEPEASFALSGKVAAESDTAKAVAYLTLTTVCICRA